MPPWRSLGLAWFDFNESLLIDELINKLIDYLIN